MNNEFITAMVMAALLVRVGLALYAAGLSRAKNSAAAVMRGLCDLCIATLAFWAIGGALLAQTSNPFLGIAPRWLMAVRSPADRFFFDAVLVLVSTGVAGAAVAERSRFLPLLILSAAMGGFIVPVAGSWVWRGWLNRLGFIDVAGASALHLTAGAAAAVAVLMIGPRDGKYHQDGSASVIPGHSLPLASVGVLLMFVGWLPYVGACAISAGAAGARAALNTLLAGAAAGAAGLIFAHVRYGKPDILITLTALLGGLVAASAGAAVIEPPAAVVVGAVAGFIVPLASVAIDLRCHLDDPASVISIHGVGAVWGLVAAGLFAPAPWAQRMRLLGVQIIGAAAVTVMAALVCWVLFGLLKPTMGLRSKQADEYDGLDLAEHDIGAYPDFQQNMIKSYHLREV